MIAAALRVWPQAVIEEALGEEVAAVLPEVIRLVELRARIPRYQRDMLRVLAEWQGTTVDEVLTRELEGVASAYSSDLAGAVPDFPARHAVAGARRGDSGVSGSAGCARGAVGVERQSGAGTQDVWLQL